MQPVGVIPFNISAKGAYGLAYANLDVPDCLISPREQSEWAHYAKHVQPAILFEKFADALDQFHAAYHASTLVGHDLSDDDRDYMHSKWNAAQILGAQIVKRLSYTSHERPFGHGGAIAEALFFLNDFWEHVPCNPVDAWRGRMDYYRDVDPMVMQKIVNAHFARNQNNYNLPGAYNLQ